MIDFNKQLVFDPKIEIVGNEVPLAAMEKTGAVLQDRYDKSYEQYSMADEALKQMEASANPVDREKAKELRGIYNQEMQGILQKGDFHNMRQQTASLARNAAINYKTIAERNQKIQSDLEALSKDPRYRLDPEGARKEYLSKIAPVNINPETRTVSDFTVTPYNAAADFETADKLLQIAPTLRAKLLKAKGSYFGSRTLPTGEKVNTIETQGGGYRILDNSEIEEELKSYIVTDPAFQAYIKRDVGRMGLDVNSDEGKIAYDQLVKERTADTSKALGKMYEIDENMNQNTFSVATKPADDGSGGGKKPKPALFTQRRSNVFKNNAADNVFKIDDKGEIVANIGSLNAQSGAPAYVSGTYNNDYEEIQKLKAQGAAAVENSTVYKRLKTHLMHLGDISSKSTKTEINKAIVNFWNNQINDAESSIAVAKPGDKEANDYIDEINKSYFGTATPDASKSNSSILNGQLAQSSFTNEKGQLMTAQQVFDATKDRNVRVTGWVNQIVSPFEYGSHYMTAVNPDNGEQQHYLIEPDLNTKNSGAYFANRILNSTRQSSLVTKWEDGNGVSYEATPLKGGKSFIVYVNGDDSTPINLDQNDLQVLSQLPAGEANIQMQALYESKLEDKK
jgi:hypothetical protein